MIMTGKINSQTTVRLILTLDIVFFFASENTQVWDET